ncbi:MAG: hypothetical protein HZB17_04385, partial [Chloroflexi bacterium]|nr:hypothetical protein [Chloroflexota bacterium]
LAGGFIGSPFWWFNLPLSFAWALPPLASRMLAVAGWAFAVLCFLVLEKLSARRMTLSLIVLAVYLAPIVAVVLLFHLNRFDFTAPITYAFLIIAGGMAVVSLYYTFRLPTFTPNESGEGAHTFTKYWFGALAVVMILWGLALFITDNGPSNLIWVWPGDLLTSRLIATMLFAIAAGSIYAARHRDAANPMLSMTLTYGFGVALANLWSMLGNKPIQFSYLTVFGIVGIGSTVLLVLGKRTES